ncbi:ABC transporter permease [Stappia sp.]|uniref:ABC transporter permease n=1 Tax=Stappia sp. TaxID=1870903 RepID=UPI003A99C188
MMFLLGKVSRTAFTVLLALTFTFVLLRLSGDPALALLGVDATPEALEHFRTRYALDQGIVTQFLSYLSNLAAGDFGTSLRDGRPVEEVVFETVPRTMQLMGAGFLLALAVGVPAGMYAATRQGTVMDRLIISFSVTGFCMPNFFLGLLLILVFTLWLRLLPAGGASGPAHFVMPVITLTTAYMGIVARYARASMITVLDRPFLLAARARGASPAAILWRHALPNAAIPILTVSGLIFGSLLGGAAVVETVFSWPGMGRLLVNSVLSKDLPVVQCIVILLALVMVFTNLCIDIAYRFLDPRIASSEARQQQVNA